ncbi:hypothetical protein [Streptomyces capoamus]|uniref:hypothetical protein n=1 Tax=Streptomyces capoamus TaxID=68183 RepID=UPI00339A555A
MASSHAQGATACAASWARTPRRAKSLWAAVPACQGQSADAEGPLPALLTCVVAPGFTWSVFMHRD